MPKLVARAFVFGYYFGYITVGCHWYDVWDKNTILAPVIPAMVREVQSWPESNPNLHPCGPYVIVPDTYLLHLQLFVGDQETHCYHHAPGLQQAQSELCWDPFNLLWGKILRTCFDSTDLLLLSPLVVGIRFWPWSTIHLYYSNYTLKS